MKKILSLFVLLAAAAFGQYSPTPLIYPFNVTQQTYTDVNFHTTPYAVLYSNTGLPTIVFDPSTSLVDQTNAFRHASKAFATPGVPSTPLLAQVYPGIVNTNFQTQVFRLATPFSITASTTLTTIPFTIGYVQTNGHYKFVAELYIVSGGGGTKIDMGGTCNTSNFVASYFGYSTTTILYGGKVTSFLSGPSGSSTAANYIEIKGELDVTNGGTFVIQFAQNGSNATASTVMAGSTLTLTQIP